jgi:hypothetical protein
MAVVIFISGVLGIILVPHTLFVDSPNDFRIAPHQFSRSRPGSRRGHENTALTENIAEIRKYPCHSTKSMYGTQ